MEDKLAGITIRNLHSGSLVAVDHPGGRLHGVIAEPVYKNLVWMLVTPSGTLHAVYYASCCRVGEKTVWGQDLWDGINSLEVDKECRRLLSLRGMQKAIKRAVSTVSSPHEGRGVLESWEIPLSLCLRDRPNELSPQLVRYLDSSPIERAALQRALAILKRGGNNRGGRDFGSYRQYELYVACVLGNAQPAWIADAWGISRQAVHDCLNRARRFVDNYVAS